MSHPNFLRDVEWFIQNRPDLVGNACYAIGNGDKRNVLSIADPNQFKRLLRRIWDPDEFLSAHGIRSLSQYHHEHPFRFGDRSQGFEPGEAEVKLKAGNSNWRGPVWFPTSYLLIPSFLQLIGRWVRPPRYGDATEEDMLETAGLERARGLIAALPNDKDNLVITVVVRQRFPKMRIVARSAD
jgi:TrkA-N domain